jgi:hypothetical protein
MDEEKFINQQRKLLKQRLNERKQISQIRKNLLMFLQVLNDLEIQQKDTILHDDSSIVSRTDKLLHYTSQIELYKLQSSLYYLCEIVMRLESSMNDQVYKIELHKN